MEFGIIIHGGAWNIPDESKQDHLNGVNAACKLGNEMLADSRSAIDVVEAVVSLMEDDPTFDAGTGSFLNQSGEVEMDAIIASQDFNLGSVCAIQNVKNPIKVARLVRDKSEHVMFAGRGASEFAYANGIEKYSPESLLVGRELERYEALKSEITFSTKTPFKRQGMGTVGTVVLDKLGNFAIGVSTGGTAKKLAGRVGDTPLWGAGGYVTPQGGAAATGFGESLIKVLMTQRVVNYISQRNSAKEACIHSVADLDKFAEGLGGVIALSKDGFGLAFNTPRMAYAIQIEAGNRYTGIDPSDLMVLDQ